MSSTNSNPLHVSPTGDGLLHRLDAARATAENLATFLELLALAARHGASPESLALGLSVCCDAAQPVVCLLSPREAWRERLHETAIRLGVRESALPGGGAK